MSTGSGATLLTPSGTHTVAVNERLILGRDPTCDIVIDDPRVSRTHVELIYKGGCWRLRDLGSRNGMFLGGERTTEVVVTRPVVVRLADPANGAQVEIRPETVVPDRPANGPEPTARYPVETKIRIGRAPDNDIVVTDVLASRYHAEVRKVGAELHVVDCDSRNGTYLNGQPVEYAAMRPRDELSIGKHQFVFDGAQLQEYVDTGRISLAARDVTVRIGDRTVLDSVSFRLGECSLLAILGPSGAGKSTLLGALVGSRRDYSGGVDYDGRNLHANYADLRHRIGFVPQDDILHRQLTVRRALTFAAQLRLPQDVTPRERTARIDEVLRDLDLRDRANQRIDSLSGGQRKRTSVALELLTQPSLLLLDEPTSGLDPALDRDVMVSLRHLADGGRTVVVVTHSVLHLDVCDKVLVLTRGGQVGYFGSPTGLLDFFGAEEYAAVFKAVTDQPDYWARKFRELSGAAAPPPPRSPSSTAAPGAAPGRQDFGRQVSVLSRRMLAVIVADRLFAMSILGLPLYLAALAHAVPGGDGLGPPTQGRGGLEAQQLLVILVIGAAFMGAAAGIRELVGERGIFLRELAVGLSPAAYTVSKIVVFALLNGIQSVLLVYGGLLGRAGPADALLLPDPMLEIVFVVVLVTLTSTVIGMVISAVVTSSEQTMPLLVAMVMVQLALCGGLFPIHGRAGLEQLSWAMPARWAYAAAATTVDLGAHVSPGAADPLWRHTAWAWLSAVIVLGGLAVLAVLGTLRALRRLDPATPTPSGRRSRAGAFGPRGR